MARSMSMCAKSLALNKILDRDRGRRPLDLRTLHGSRALRPGCRLLCVRPGENWQEGRLFHKCQRGFRLRPHLGRQFREMWLRLGQPSRFSLVEQGANDGQLAVGYPLRHGRRNTACGRVLDRRTVSHPAPAAREDAESIRSRQCIGRKTWPTSRSSTVFISPTNLWTPSRFILMRSGGQEWEELRVAAREDRLVFEVARAGTAASPSQLKNASVASQRHDCGASPSCPRLDSDCREQAAHRIRSGHRLRLLARATSLPLPHRGNVFLLSMRIGATPALSTSPARKTSRRTWTSPRSPHPPSMPDFRLEGYADQHHYLVGASQDLLKELDRPPDLRFAKDASIAANTPPS